MRRLSVRLIILPTCAVALSFSAGLAACGGDKIDSADSLPPIVTTTTEFIPTSTADPYIQIYEIKPGENLAMVAAAYGLPVETLINFNDDKPWADDPNNIPVGAVVEVPPARMVDALPAAPSTTSTP